MQCCNHKHIFQVAMERLGISCSKRSTTRLVIICFIVFSASLMVSTIMFGNSTSDLVGSFSQSKLWNGKVQNDSENVYYQPYDYRFEEKSCLSRYESKLYKKVSPHKPSPYLLSKLHSYEHIHKRCGPHTKSYNRTLNAVVHSANISNDSSECKYIVWIPANGLGNRMISLASTFLYALLTNRVLLVNLGTDMTHIFCEPFPNTSWLLPMDFPLKNQFYNSKLRYAHSIGTMLKNNVSNNLKESFLYLNLGHSDYDIDQVFYCDKSQAILQKVPWLFLLSDKYFAPSFFLMQSFKKEASNLFPEKETVFYHLGHYLFNPSNQVWGLITRFYQAYLSNVDEIIGLQIRLFHANATPFQTVMNQILSCTLEEKLLPELATQESKPSTLKSGISKAILITSLHPDYYENIRNMYWSRPTMSGEVVQVYQPSHEEYQHFGDNVHYMKALAEIYLLSLCDELVTSRRSTFGYVAQGLGGVKAWILSKPGQSNPPCQRSVSMEPCFHYPSSYDCNSKKNVDVGSLVPYLRHCEDKRKGVKLVDDHQEL